MRVKDILVGLTEPTNKIDSVYDKITYGNIKCEMITASNVYAQRLLIDGDKKFLIQVIEVK